MKLREWLLEREWNARVLAEDKSGEDRAGWLEDADYFKRAATAAAMAEEYQAWVDFHHAGRGGFDAFMAERYPNGVASHPPSLHCNCAECVADQSRRADEADAVLNRARKIIAADQFADASKKIADGVRDNVSGARAQADARGPRRAERAKNLADTETQAGDQRPPPPPTAYHLASLVLRLNELWNERTSTEQIADQLGFCRVIAEHIMRRAEVGAPGTTDAERAEWLADKIVALGDYAKEAAAMLRRWPDPSGVLPTAVPKREITPEMMIEAAKRVGFDPVPGRLIILAGALNARLDAHGVGDTK